MPPLPSDSPDGYEMPNDSDSADDQATRQHWRNYLAARQPLSTQIHNLRIPACYLDPSLTEVDQLEVLDTYLQETVFHVNVWVNYDATMGKFYTDQRTVNCGKMRLTPAQRTHIDAEPICSFPIERVVFHLGTPFRRFCEVSLGLKIVEREDKRSPNGPLVVKQFLQVRDTSWIADVTVHHDLQSFVRDVCDGLDRKRLRGNGGLNVRVLDDLAERFVQRPDGYGALYSDTWGVWYAGDWQTCGMKKWVRFGEED